MLLSCLLLWAYMWMLVSRSIILVIVVIQSLKMIEHFFQYCYEGPKRVFTILARSNRKTFVTLSLARFARWEALWTHQEHEEKSQLERSVNSLTSQRDTYLRELRKVHASLQEVHKILAPFNFSSTTGSQVMYL